MVADFGMMGQSLARWDGIWHIGTDFGTVGTGFDMVGTKFDTVGTGIGIMGTGFWHG